MPMSPKTLRPRRKTSWTPPDFTGLFAWWDFSDASTLTMNGGTVSLVTDKSGGGRDLGNEVAINQPTLTANGQNGKSVADFTSSGYLVGDELNEFDFLLAGSDTSAVFMALKSSGANASLEAPASVGMVFQLDSPGWNVLFSRDDGTPEYLISAGIQNLTYDPPANDAMLYGTLSAFQSPKAVAVLVSPSAPSCELFDHSGTANDPFSDNTSAAAGPSVAHFVLGGYQDTDGFYQPGWTGWIGEVFVYKRATQLTAAERNIALNYLKKKWGLS